MNQPVSERVRSVDLESMSDEQKDLIAEQFGKFVQETIVTALNKLKEAAKIYGLDAHLMYEITPIGGIPHWKNPEWFKSVVKNIEASKKPVAPEKKKRQPKKPKQAKA